MKMSSDSKLVDQLAGAQERHRKLQEKRTDVMERELEIKHKKLEQDIEMENAFENFDVSAGIEEEYEELAKKNEEYIKLARNAKVFLNLDVFKDKIPLFARNIIYLSAETGTGKSTTVANLTYSYLKGASKKILILTNEENPTDVLNRIVFLNQGWVYNNHDEITDEQLEVCKKYYKALAKKVHIVHDYSNKVGGTTTTLEGIQSICKSIKKKYDAGEEPYDLILLDYIQKVEDSTKHKEASWIILKKTLYYLDNFKNVYPAPFVVFGQQKTDSTGEKAYKEKVEGWKGITNVATTVVEIKVDRENLRTEWIIRKNRFKGAVGESVFTGYEKGKYIEYTPDFANKTEIAKTQNKHKELLGGLFSQK
jgi:hypothetical protein